MREEPPDFVASMDEGIEGLKVAWSADLGYAAVDPEVASIAYKGAKVFEELGCEVEEPTVSLQHPIEYFMTIFSTGAYVSYKELYQNKRQLLTSYVRGNMELGGGDDGRGLREGDVRLPETAEPGGRRDGGVRPALDADDVGAGVSR